MWIGTGPDWGLDGTGEPEQGLDWAGEPERGLDWGWTGSASRNGDWTGAGRGRRFSTFSDDFRLLGRDFQ